MLGAIAHAGVQLCESLNIEDDAQIAAHHRALSKPVEAPSITKINSKFNPGISREHKVELRSKPAERGLCFSVHPRSSRYILPSKDDL